MPEIVYSSLASAHRNRATLNANRAEADRRVADDQRIAERFDAVQRRKQIADEIVVRQERSIRLRRDDLEENFEVARLYKEQTRFSDTVASDTSFQNRQAEIASKIADQRAERAAKYDVTLSELDESLALDQLPQGDGGAEAVAADAAAFRNFLAERDNRNAERALSARDRAIQQQIDLRIADDNLRSVPEGADLPRGALVDVFG